MHSAEPERRDQQRPAATPCRRRRRAAADERLLGRAEAARSARVSSVARALPSLAVANVAPGADARLARARDHRVGVVVDVGERLLADLARQPRLRRVVARRGPAAPARRPGTTRAPTGSRVSSVGLPRIRKPRTVVWTASSRCCGQVGGGDHGLRVAGALARVVLAVDRQRQPAEHARDDRRRSAPRRSACGPSAGASCDPLVRVRAGRAQPERRRVDQPLAAAEQQDAARARARRRASRTAAGGPPGSR